jgi:Ca2+-binding EF-hand superfamily protein
MPTITHEQLTQLRDIFTYHAPDADQQITYEKLRNAAYDFSVTLIELTPVCADQSAALRKLRECVMTANAAIALRGK